MTLHLLRLLAPSSLLFCAAAWLVPTTGHAGRKVLDPNNMNLDQSPRQDFYRYANGGWLSRTTIPADHGRWGAFEEVNATVVEQLRSLAEEAQRANPPAGSAEQKVGDFYESGMDAAAIESSGGAPLTTGLSMIAQIDGPVSLAETLAELHKVGAAPLFAVTAAPDAQDSNTIIMQLYQGGLGLPVCGDYFDADKAARRAAYVAHLTTMFGLLGYPDALASARASAVMRIETALAEDSLTEVQRRDPQSTYNKRTIKQLADAAPGFAWSFYFAKLGMGDVDSLNVEHPAFFARVGTLAQGASLEDLRHYLTWHLMNQAAPYLSEAFVQADFAFYGQTLNGTQALAPRYKRVLSTCDQYVGEALGQLYVRRFFSADAKERVLSMVDDLRAALGQRIDALEWMSAATKEKAQSKLRKLTVKIGYPDTWIDYTPLAIGKEYVSNVWRAHAFLFGRDLARAGKSTDRSRWEMTPQTVNAYYSPSLNEIVFPAAILQYPFFDADADDAFNYGAIGGVIGHELTHGYDDQGRQFDADGNLRDWWTPDDAAAFNTSAKKIIDQFDHYTIFGKTLKGQLTQGENIADLGGAKLAYQAFQNAKARGNKTPLVDGFTPEQRFFLAWAQVWRNQVREATAWQRADTDPHAPGEWRTNGPLSNMPEFYRAFAVQSGDAMCRSDATRVTIW